MEHKIDWSKRDINSKIIKIMNLYDVLVTSIEDGKKKIESERKAVDCGVIFEEMFIKVFNKYGIGKIRKITQIVGDIPYGHSHNLDYQIIYDQNNGRCWGEAKFSTTSDFDEIVKKLHQVITGLFAISLNTIEKYPIWYFIFNPNITEKELIDIVRNELIKNKEKLAYQDRENPQKLLKFFKPVVFSNIWSIAPLIGGRIRLSDETDIHKLKLWFDEFSNFSNIIPREWYGITKFDTQSREQIPKDGEKKKDDDVLKLSIQEETLITFLAAYTKKKEKGNWKVPGKRPASFKEFLNVNLHDYLEDAISIGKESGVLIQGGGYTKLGSKFENILIQNSVGQLQHEVRKFLLERIKKSSVIMSEH